MELEPVDILDYQELQNNEGMIPCALITNSCNSVVPENIIKEILGISNLPEPVQILDGIRSFPWHIDTKYYQSDISLCVMEKRTLGNQEFANSVNAVLICFDSNSNDGLEVVEQWFTFTKEFQPDIQILVCDQCKPETCGSGVTKIQAQTWCVRNGFELVELNAEESEDSDVEDDFQESLGIKRIVQALQAHLWPNLVLKDRGRVAPHAGLQNVLNGIGLMGLNSNQYRSNIEDNIQNIEENRQGTTTNSYAITSSPSSENSEHKYTESKPNVRKSIAAIKPIIKSPTNSEANDENTASVNSDTGTQSQADIHFSQQSVLATSSTASAAVANSVEPTLGTKAKSNSRNDRIDSMVQAMDSMSDETFEELFQNLNEMKKKAQNLSPSQRKSYAEQMAVAFWRSVGGNESEIDGILDDDDDDA